MGVPHHQFVCHTSKQTMKGTSDASDKYFSTSISTIALCTCTCVMNIYTINNTILLQKVMAVYVFQFQVTTHTVLQPWQLS